jgi:hypothetical protein
MADFNYDIKEFTNIKKYDDQIIREHAGRNDLFTEMEQAYHMESPELTALKNKQSKIKLTLYPGPRNAIDGLMRLMIATDPDFKIPIDVERVKVQEQSNKIEKISKAIWTKAGRVYGDPVHYDLIRMAGLFGEVHAGVINTQELIDDAGDNNAWKQQAERVNAITPFLFDVYHSKRCYPEWSRLGLKGWVGTQATTVGELEDRYGAKAKNALKYEGQEYSRFHKRTLREHWDLKWRCTYVVGANVPIKMEEHGLKEIPIASHLVEGSKVFDTPEQRRAPFLYKYIKSGLWNRQNLWLTAFYTILSGIGLTPAFKETQGQEGQFSHIDWEKYRVVVPPGNTFEVMPTKGILTPEMVEGYNLAKELETESTMYKQAFGEPLGKNTAFSYVALMSQAGRLPLMVVQKKGGWIIGDLMRIALTQHKDLGSDVFTSKAFGSDMVLNAGDIPDYFEIEANLEIILPQERLQLLSIINQATDGQDPIASKRWGRELLNIGQSDEMQEEIWSEQTAEAEKAMYLTQKMQEAAQLAQQMQGGGGAGGGIATPMRGGGGGMGGENQANPRVPVKGSASPNTPDAQSKGGGAPMEGDQGAYAEGEE